MNEWAPVESSFRPPARVTGAFCSLGFKSNHRNTKLLVSIDLFYMILLFHVNFIQGQTMTHLFVTKEPLLPGPHCSKHLDTSLRSPQPLLELEFLQNDSEFPGCAKAGWKNGFIYCGCGVCDILGTIVTFNIKQVTHRCRHHPPWCRSI